MPSASILITSSRMPFALDLIRKFGESGHRVIAADTFKTAPGSQSRHVSDAVITPAPAEQPDAYVDAIIETIKEHGIDLLVPSFEEIFYLARHRERLCEHVDAFLAGLDTLTQLHDKVAFTELCRELGLDVPPSTTAASREELGDAIGELESGFFARPAFSRGGLELLTNRGSLAGELELEDCSPSPENPWLIQPYVEGEDRCTYGIAQHGRLAAHVTYVHPHTIEGAGGIVFESIEDPEVVEATRKVVEATNFHGQIALDFIRDGQRLVPVECNPRATAGVSLMSAPTLCAAMLGDPMGEPLVTPAGRKRKITAALLRKMILDASSIPDSLRALAEGGEDVYAAGDDPLPALFQVLSYSHVLRYRWTKQERSERSNLIAAYFHDLRWNGEPLE